MRVSIVAITEQYFKFDGIYKYSKIFIICNTCNIKWGLMGEYVDRHGFVNVTDSGMYV